MRASVSDKVIDVRVWAGPFQGGDGRPYVQACTEKGWQRWRAAHEAPDMFRVRVDELLP